MQSSNQKTNTRKLITFLLNFISLEDNSIIKSTGCQHFTCLNTVFALNLKKNMALILHFIFIFISPPRTKFFEKNLVNQLIKKCWPYIKFKLAIGCFSWCKCFYMSNFVDWENIIHFGNFFGSIRKKTYFLALGTTPIKGVGFIAGKITVILMSTHICFYGEISKNISY